MDIFVSISTSEPYLDEAETFFKVEIQGRIRPYMACFKLIIFMDIIQLYVFSSSTLLPLMAILAVAVSSPEMYEWMYIVHHDIFH